MRRWFSIKPHFDFRYIKANKESIQRNILLRKAPPVSLQLIIDSCDHCSNLRQLRDSKRFLQREIGKGLKAGSSQVVVRGESFQASRDFATELKHEIKRLDKEIDEAFVAASTEASFIPNSTHSDVPLGDESKAIILETCETPSIESWMKDHVELATRLDLLDIDRATKTSGANFYFLKNELAIMELALIQFSMQMAIENGYTAITTPDIIKDEILKGCGFLPRDETPQHYPLPEGKSLSATAEIPLCGYHANEIVDIPKRYVAVGRAFRTEAGNRGTNNRGLYRVHQFTKVELFTVSDTLRSGVELDRIVELQKKILTALKLPFRVLLMPSEELGGSAYKKIDIEVFFPGMERWGEVSSASNTTNYQSRRLGVRYRLQNSTDLEYAHLVNGTALAVPRIIAAIIENYQREDGFIHVPLVLQPFLGSKSVIKK